MCIFKRPRKTTGEVGAFGAPGTIPDRPRHWQPILSPPACNGMNTIMVTHEMGFAKGVAQRVLFTDDSQMVAASNP